MSGEARKTTPVGAAENLARRFLEILPDEVYANISVLQPSVGCFNLCSFCSQESGGFVRYLDPGAIETIIEALDMAAKSVGVPYLGCGKSYKPGVLFPYLDNDPGIYPYLDGYIAALGCRGVKTRLSSAGWPRRNSVLNAMHARIVSELSENLNAVRFSLNCFQIGMRKHPEDYICDLISSAAVYRSLFEFENDARARIDVCFQPDILVADVDVVRNGDKTTISCGEYELVVATGDLGLPGIACQSFGKSTRATRGQFIPFSNIDGDCYAFVPDGCSDYRRGICYYPETLFRNGGVLDARSPIEALIGRVASAGLVDFNILDEWNGLLYDETVLSRRRAQYLQTNVEPVIKALSAIFVDLEIPFSRLLDGSIIRDRGVLRNAGRGSRYYRQLASGPEASLFPQPRQVEEPEREVWRIFPVVRGTKPGRRSAVRLGRKSFFEAEELRGGGDVFLAVCAVDPQTHSNYDKKASSLRRRFLIPIDDIAGELLCEDFAEGVEHLQVPGFSPDLLQGEPLVEECGSEAVEREEEV